MCDIRWATSLIPLMSTVSNDFSLLFLYVLSVHRFGKMVYKKPECKKTAKNDGKLYVVVKLILLQKDF